jgi:hypothetical protein
MVSASHNRLTGGTGFTVEPTVWAALSAVVSQFVMVFAESRNARAAMSRDQPRRLLSSRIRKRTEGL